MESSELSLRAARHLARGPALAPGHSVLGADGRLPRSGSRLEEPASPAHEAPILSHARRHRLPQTGAPAGRTMRRTQARAKDGFSFQVQNPSALSPCLQFAYELKFFIGKVGISVPEFWGQVAQGGVYKGTFGACGHFLTVTSAWAKTIPPRLPPSWSPTHPPSPSRSRSVPVPCQWAACAATEVTAVQTCCQGPPSVQETGAENRQRKCRVRVPVEARTEHCDTPQWPPVSGRETAKMRGAKTCVTHVTVVLVPKLQMHTLKPRDVR